nr:POTRA domain-containing protein [Veronia nyctiphanis]
MLLTPAVGDMETADFDRMPEALQKGYQITRLSEASLKPLKVDSAVYQDYVERKQARRKLLEFGDQMTISDVVINNNTSLSDEVLKDRLDVDLGLLDTAKLEESISNLNALDRFESVDFEIHKNDGSNALFLDVEERSWGPSFLDFRVNIEDDFSTSTLYSAGVRITNTGLSEYGAELMTELELGNRKVAGVELFAPLVASQEFFIRPWGKYIAEQVTQYDLTDDEKKIDEQESVIILTSRTKEWRMGAELGWQPELWSQFSVGADFVVGEETRGGALFRREFSQDKQYISITLDTLDNRVFPSSGSYFHAQLSSVRDTVLDNQLFEKVIDSNQVEVELSHAQSIGRHTLFGELSYQGTDVDRAAAITSFGFDTGELVVRLRELGGLFNLSGLPQGRLRGDNSAFGSLIYRYRLQDNDFGLFKTPVYVGASIERGSVWNNPDFSIKDIPFYNAGSIFAGVDTIIGPVLVAYGITDSEHDSFYLSLGTQF